ncbi:50S ribosomal protein L21 [Robiginitalea sp. SC105]|uniref:50S ribosomal protein L21 n=1 Tax=Robiginitalea sp. SC105 TaxID=2762332 RepID=UPI00163B5B5A|nr:50S ribosomal protein L21 [Robiginitalea sp. SC105]MBC2837953.1 50S ribosomal protein L21 [Robiginitalea sp. SC105]
MYAIVEIAGQQFKVAKDQKVYVHRLREEEGQKVSFDQVLLIGDGDSVTIGAPAIDGAAVEAKVVKHLKGDKVIVFKKKRRKGYQKKNGHRQSLTELMIEGIVAKGAKKAAPKKAEPATKEAAPAKKEAPAKAEAKKEAAAEKKAPAKPAPKAAEDLSSKTVAELREMAKAQEITGYSSMKKAELIEALGGK